MGDSFGYHKLLSNFCSKLVYRSGLSCIIWYVMCIKTCINVIGYSVSFSLTNIIWVEWSFPFFSSNNLYALNGFLFHQTEYLDKFNLVFKIFWHHLLFFNFQVWHFVEYYTTSLANHTMDLNDYNHDPKWPFQRKVDVSKSLARKVEEKKVGSEKWF